MMSVEEIAMRLDNAFNLLTEGNRAAMPRHQTLRATIDWSYELLSDPERILFRRLGVFADGFTLEAAEAVASDEIIPKHQILGVLGHLVGKSLVSARAGSANSETRYRMLETIRQYARERLEQAGEYSALRERHLAFFAAFAGRAAREMYDQDQVLWWRWAGEDVENLRLALSWDESVLPPEPSKLRSVLRNQFAIVDKSGTFGKATIGRRLSRRFAGCCSLTQ